MATLKQLVEYIVLDIEPIGPANNRMALAEATVARISDFGRNDTVFYTKTHLGNILHPGEQRSVGAGKPTTTETTRSNSPELGGVRKTFWKHPNHFDLASKVYLTRLLKLAEAHSRESQHLCGVHRAQKCLAHPHTRATQTFLLRGVR